MLTPEKILAELVAIPSASHESNAPVIRWIERYLKEIGWFTRLVPYKDPSGTSKQNLIGSPQPLADACAEVELALICHTDTVPPAPGWENATTLREQDGLLYGLGSCDVKGFAACVLAAIQTIRAAQLRRQLCVVFTADEEIGCRGMRVLAEANALRPRYAIVGEPTSMNVAYAGKGYCLASIKIHGKAAHSAYPQEGVSAILAAAHMIVEIQVLAAQLADEREDAFSPPYTTINIGVIEGGTAKNVVPETCSFLVEWRPLPSQPTQTVVEQLYTIAQRIEKDSGGKLWIEVQPLRQEQGFATDPKGVLVRTLQAAGCGALETIAFGSEAPWLERMGTEAVVIGPGSMLTAHSARECVPQSDLTRCVEALRSIIAQFCEEHDLPTSRRTSQE